MKNEISRFHLGEIFFLGLVFGALYFVVNLFLFFPSEQLFLMTGGFLRANLFIYSFCIWTLTFITLSLIFHVITFPVFFFGNSRGLFFLRRFLVFFLLLFIFITGFIVYKTLVLMSRGIANELKIEAMKNFFLVYGLVVAVISLVLSALLSFLFRDIRRIMKPRKRYTLLLASLLLLYTIVVNLGFDAASLGKGAESQRHPNDKRLIMFVIDAGSWNVLKPFMEQGDLPNFKKLMEVGTCGYIETYGRKYTPPSWTSIATGKKELKHGVHDFTNTTLDWQAAPLWSIMSSFGRRVGVVNWICTWPPFEVYGGLISQVISHRSGLSFFSPEFEQYAEAADSFVTKWGEKSLDADSARVAYADEEMNRLLKIDTQIISKDFLDFIAYGYYSTDKLQHFFWRDMSPDHFQEKYWGDTPPRPEYKETIRNAWILVDEFLSYLMTTYGENTNYFVLSDHGALPVPKRPIFFDMDGLLEHMGYLVKNNGEVDYQNSTCYTTKRNVKVYLYNLEINIEGNGDLEGTDRERYDAVRSDIIDKLKGIRVKDTSTPIFSTVEASDRVVFGRTIDIRVFANKVLMEMAGPTKKIIVGENEIPLKELMKYREWSGNHRARGIFLAKGPSIKHRYAGAWTIDEPYTIVLRYGNGLNRICDALYNVVRVLHLVDDVTNLDIAPTILYLSDLPIAEDMDGKVIRAMINEAFLEKYSVKTVPTYEKGAVAASEVDDKDKEEVIKKLKALGYL